MSKIVRRIGFVTMLVVLLAGLAAPLGAFSVLAAPPQPAGAAPIRLKAASFFPAQGQRPGVPSHLEIAGYAAAQRGYYLVQFTGPIQAEWKAALEDAGADVLSYVPDFAFKVRMQPAQAARVKRFDSVAWVGLFHPAYKLNPDLQRSVGREGLYEIVMARGGNGVATVAALKKLGVQIVKRSGQSLVIAADAPQLDAVAQVLDVAWIDNFMLYETHNEYGGGSIMKANIPHANGYDGSTQTVAVADTGLGGGTATTAHRDLPSSRVTAIYNWPGVSDNCWTIYDDGAQDVDSGHGTHTVLSVASDGGPSGEGKGTAPAASIIFQAVENWADMRGFCGFMYPDGYYLTGLPVTIEDLFQQAYNAGARIHSNSWGSAAAGEYTEDSQGSDNFIWNNPDMLITFSAGNDGIDANSDGVIDNDSMGAPATAKNVLTVGASEGERADNFPCDTGLSGCTGVNDIFTWGAAWPSDYPANPIASDPSAGDAQQMAAFSSRGPTDDGRIKPDVVAPGTWILSGYSDLYQQGYDGSTNPQNGAWQYDGYGYPLDQYYKYMSGTSMSNPLAAGAAATVRDYYQKAHSIAASAALVKATLINSAVDLLDENNDGVDDNDYPIPNVHEGWGLIDLAAATDGSGTFVEHAGLNTGGSASYDYGVSTSGSPFKVTAVWSDYPSATGVSKNLVNDLDLVVTSPSGAVYKGNVFSGGWSQTGGSADRTNNVENVYVASAEAGTWTVTVSGYNVPQGAQPFALVVDGALGAPAPTATPAPTDTPIPPTATPVPTNTPVPPTPTTAPTSTPVPPTPTTGPTNTPAPTNTPVPPTATPLPTNTPVPPTATPVPTNTPVPPTPTPTPEPAGTSHVGDLDGTTTTQGRWRWDATVTVLVHDDGENPVANATVYATWSGGYSSSASCVTDGSGTCSMTSGKIFKWHSSVTLTVDNVTHGTLSYQASANHDPDGDSNGTTITVYK